MALSDSRIPESEMTELLEAETLKTEHTDLAEADQEENAVIHAIDSAANTGAHSIIWNHELSQDMIDKLEAKGYTVVENRRAFDPTKQYIIEGF